MILYVLCIYIQITIYILPFVLVQVIVVFEMIRPHHIKFKGINQNEQFYLCFRIALMNLSTEDTYIICALHYLNTLFFSVMCKNIFTLKTGEEQELMWKLQLHKKRMSSHQLHTSLFDNVFAWQQRPLTLSFLTNLSFIDSRGQKSEVICCETSQTDRKSR